MKKCMLFVICASLVSPFVVSALDVNEELKKCNNQECVCNPCNCADHDCTLQLCGKENCDCATGCEKNK